MSIFLENLHARLVEELKRVGPPLIAKQAGIARATVYNWMEKGNVSLDKLTLLDKAGVDVTYVLTGQRSIEMPTPGPSTEHESGLTPRQAALLDNYQHTDEQGKKIIEAAALAAATQNANKQNKAA